jgi:hypothetical protein
MSLESNNASYIINVLETKSSKKELEMMDRPTFAKETQNILNELHRIMKVLIGIEKDLANELPRYVSDIDFYKSDDGLEPPKKRSRMNLDEMC